MAQQDYIYEHLEQNLEPGRYIKLTYMKLVLPIHNRDGIIRSRKPSSEADPGVANVDSAIIEHWIESGTDIVNMETMEIIVGVTVYIVVYRRYL